MTHNESAYVKHLSRSGITRVLGASNVALNGGVAGNVVNFAIRRCERIGSLFNSDGLILVLVTRHAGNRKLARAADLDLTIFWDVGCNVHACSWFWKRVVVENV